MLPDSGLPSYEFMFKLKPRMAHSCTLYINLIWHSLPLHKYDEGDYVENVVGDFKVDESVEILVFLKATSLVCGLDYGKHEAFYITLYMQYTYRATRW